MCIRDRFQIGALDDDTAEMLEQSGRRFVSEDCIVRYITRNDLYPRVKLNSSKWFRQISDESTGMSQKLVIDNHKNSKYSKLRPRIMIKDSNNKSIKL